MHERAAVPSERLKNEKVKKKDAVPHALAHEKKHRPAKLTNCSSRAPPAPRGEQQQTPRNPNHNVTFFFLRSAQADLIHMVIRLMECSAFCGSHGGERRGGDPGVAWPALPGPPIIRIHTRVLLNREIDLNQSLLVWAYTE